MAGISNRARAAHWLLVLLLTFGLVGPAAAKTIVMAVQNTAVSEAVASDAKAARTYLESPGYTVRTIDQAEAESAVAGADAVFTYATVSMNRLASGFLTRGGTRD